ncbi:MAG: glycosyltransferase [Acidimicrobiia bacterium]|nr:glycosyltransferase [Acidimicrobiia bacterium]
MIEQLAYLSLHTSPLIQPGGGDAGGMNVYIDELARSMADREISVDVFTRRTHPDQPDVVVVNEHYRVIHITAGPLYDLPIAQLTDHVFDFAESVCEWARSTETRYDIVHSHYWLSGWAGLMVKRILGIPLANSFHTLARVKDATRRPDEPPSALVRIAAEHDVIAGSDCVISSTQAEYDDLLLHYGADPTRLCTSPPGVDHDLFRPADQTLARQALGIAPGIPLVLYVGRIQALKGVDVALDAFEKVQAGLPEAQMLIVGGPSGPGGTEEVAALRMSLESRRLKDAVRFHDPVPHDELAVFYQAADVLVVPSRSESFGLVAAEAQACGTPVVAARVGGLQYVVSHRQSGLLVDGWESADYADALTRILSDTTYRKRLSRAAIMFSEQFSWATTTHRLLELYAGIQG